MIGKPIILFLKSITMSQIKFYEGHSHLLKIDKEISSKYWSIASERMSFTYFEVPPNSDFKKHRHFSEQITYVLHGELFFEAGDMSYCLKPGDSIVIPSNDEHRVWTTDAGAKAVDSWTPANELY
jgi:quercetin dioxygenase-like cupin family protein